MKTDRLLSIVIYLLNHDTVSAKKLVERFEVSKRTIFRDTEQISLAGIPIKSTPGVNGGYSITDKFSFARIDSIDSLILSGKIYSIIFLLFVLSNWFRKHR